MINFAGSNDPLVVLCPHLAEPPPRPLPWQSRSGRGRTLTVGSRTRPLSVHLCSTCSQRFAATDADESALELVALTLVHRQIQQRVAALIDGLREILPLLPSAETTEPPKGRD